MNIPDIHLAVLLVVLFVFVFKLMGQGMEIIELKKRLKEAKE